MVTPQYKRAVGAFSSKSEAEAALNGLRESGFSMERVSVLAKDTDRNEAISGVDVQNRDKLKRDRTQAEDRGNTEAQEGAGIGAVTGTALGGIGGLLVGLEALVIPGVGPFLAGGTIAATLAGAGIGAAGGAIVGALTGLGIPEEDAKAYDERISHGEYLVILEGTQAEIDRAGYVLRNRGIHEWKVYNASGGYDRQPGVSSTTVNRNTQKYVDRTTTDRDVIDTTTGDPEVEIVDRREEIR
ncbi:signal transduction histidine kinase LytS [cyanobacterium TDX16]|nr:signal transduction histidine kinase LytS [cyanobacterium TDX16]